MLNPDDVREAVGMFYALRDQALNQLDQAEEDADSSRS